MLWFTYLFKYITISIQSVVTAQLKVRWDSMVFKEVILFSLIYNQIHIQEPVCIQPRDNVGVNSYGIYYILQM